MRARGLSLLLLTALVVEGLAACGTGCPTPADCADVTCGCIQPIALRPDPNVAELAREAPPPRRSLEQGQAW